MSDGETPPSVGGEHRPLRDVARDLCGWLEGRAVAPPRRRRASDPCVVATGPELAAIINGFVRNWNADHPDHYDVGPFAQLASETGLPADTIRTVWRRTYPTTELRIADAILTALGRPDALSDGSYPFNEGGTVEIRPRSPRHDCCGSLSGSV